MDLVFLLARIMLVPLFITSGLAHFTPAMVGYAQAMGVKNADRLVPLSGAAIILGSIMVVFGIFGDIGALLLLGFLVVITPQMHAFWKIEDPEMRQAQQLHFFKNLSMAGGALLLFWVFNQTGDFSPYTLTDSLLGTW